jgi:hypothetical protein
LPFSWKLEIKDNPGMQARAMSILSGLMTLMFVGRYKGINVSSDDRGVLL